MLSLRLHTRWRRAIAPAVCVLLVFYLTLGHSLYGRLEDAFFAVADVPAGITEACRTQGWRPFRPSPGLATRKVYDLIMVNDEMDWLEIRFNTTWNEVDYFVIVESDKTFTGLDKPLFVKEHIDSPPLQAYRDKVIYHKLEFPADFNAEVTWDFENLQRDAMFTQVFPTLQGPQAPSPDDVIIVADVDEVPRPSTLALLRACAFPRRLSLHSLFYYYGYQFLRNPPEWPFPHATYYTGPTSTVVPSALRESADDSRWAALKYTLGIGGRGIMHNASWHCSGCFATTAQMLNKLSSFSHSSLNTERFRAVDRMVDRVRHGLDLWDREQYFDKLEGNADVPQLVLAEPDRFRYLLDRQGPEGGFVDYKPPSEGTGGQMAPMPEFRDP